MPFTEDLSVFFSASEFATPATWTPLGGAPVSANVILDMPTEDILGGRAQSDEYQAMLQADEFPNITRNDEVRIADVEYTVREVKLIDDGKLKSLSLTKK